VPELYKTAPLILSFEVVSDILLGNIVRWNDTKIAELNPSIADKLPGNNITVVYNTNPDPITLMYTSALSRSVPEFATAVRPLNRRRNGQQLTRK
jgi:phosphate transport system substrate-binding protein